MICRYRDIEQPLGQYVAVFVAFGVPAALLSTTWCTSITTDATIPRCFAICEMVLSLRSMATALVYFTDKQHRVELWCVCTGPTSVSVVHVVDVVSDCSERISYVELQGLQRLMSYDCKPQ